MEFGKSIDLSAKPTAGNGGREHIDCNGLARPGEHACACARTKTSSYIGTKKAEKGLRPPLAGLQPRAQRGIIEDNASFCIR